MSKIKVYRKDTGALVWVPQHFMDHPVLSKPFRKTPTQRAADSAAEERVAIEQAALAAIPTTSTESPASVATSQSASAGDDKKE